MLHGKKKDHRIIGICVAEIEDESVKDTCMSIGAEAIRRGYKVLLFTAMTNMKQEDIFSHGEASIFDLVDHELVDVLFVLPESIKKEEVWKHIIDQAKAEGLPVIAVDHKTQECPCIVYDYSHAFGEIVRHVVEDHGCRKVNFIAGLRGNSFSDERLECYRQVLEENGIEYDPTRVGYGDFWEVPARKVMEEFLKDERGLPEAIVCCNDLMAIAACSMLRDNGYRVPEDVIVTGFDGIELERYMVPRLVTARLDLDTLSRTAVDMADAALEGRELPGMASVPFITSPSESCGCLDVPDESYSDKILDLFGMIKRSEGHEMHMFSYVYNTMSFTDFEDMADMMVDYADLYTWCCLNSSFINDEQDARRWHTHFTRRMHLLMSCKNGAVTKHVDFDAPELLPDLEDALEEHDILMFMPMHFQEEIMGYMAVSVNTYNFNFTNTHRFLNNTNQIFENLKNRIRVQKAYAKVEQMHMRDPMTNIYNRRGFYAMTEDMADRLKDGVDYILFSCDLDGLKQINDTYGHSIGDEALMVACRIISSGCGQECVCARFGGDEFIVLAADREPEKCINEYLERVQRELAEYNKSSGKEYKVGVSIGAKVIGGRPDQETIDEAMKHADRDMYVIKKQHHAED